MVIETVVSALVGLLGTGLTTYSDYKLKQLETENKIKLLEAETKSMLAEAEANVKVAQVNAQASIELAEAQAFTTSIQSQKQMVQSDLILTLMQQKGWVRYLTYPVGLFLLTLMGLADVLGQLMRPILTIYSLAIASWVTYQCWKLLPEISSYAEAWRSWQDACDIVMMLAVTMVTWWFGDRRVAKNLMHLKGSKK